MKKTIFLAVALSLLLCATALALGPANLVHGQRVAVTFEAFRYPTGQTVDTRLFIRNLDPEKRIFVWRVIFVGPDGGDVIFYNGSTDPNDHYFDLVIQEYGAPLLLNPYESTAFLVSPEMIDDSNHAPFYTTHGGGRYFYYVDWYAEGGRDLAVPPEIWGYSHSRYGTPLIRYNFERWEGRVMKEYAPSGK